MPDRAGAYIGHSSIRCRAERLPHWHWLAESSPVVPESARLGLDGTSPKKSKVASVTWAEALAPQFPSWITLGLEVNGLNAFGIGPGAINLPQSNGPRNNSERVARISVRGEETILAPLSPGCLLRGADDQRGAAWPEPRRTPEGPPSATSKPRTPAWCRTVLSNAVLPLIRHPAVRLRHNTAAAS